jgi:ABC-type multidrug transport system ATPase subunit
MLDVINLSKSFDEDNKFEVLKDISFSVKKGSLYVSLDQVVAAKQYFFI